jgi:hypothetical protein
MLVVKSFVILDEIGGKIEIYFRKIGFLVGRLVDVAEDRVQ